jgi:hypothetical protein
MPLIVVFFHVNFLSPQADHVLRLTITCLSSLFPGLSRYNFHGSLSLRHLVRPRYDLAEAQKRAVALQLQGHQKVHISDAAVFAVVLDVVGGLRQSLFACLGRCWPSGFLALTREQGSRRLVCKINRPDVPST